MPRSSRLLLLLVFAGIAACSDDPDPDPGQRPRPSDAGTPDSGVITQDAGLAEVGPSDVATRDAEASDSGSDAGTGTDAGSGDVGDSGMSDPDAGDAGVVDSGGDAGTPGDDAGPSDGSLGDGGPGPLDVGPGDVGPGDVGPGDVGPGPLDVGPGDAAPGDIGDAGPGDLGPGDAGPSDVGDGGAVGSDGGVPTTYDSATIVRLLATAICENRTRCVPAFYPFNAITQTDCINEEASRLQGVYSSLGSAVSAGTITYDATQLARCIDAFRNNSCDDGILTSTCDFFQGNVPTGGGCVFSDECSATDWCETTQLLGCGTCQARAQTNQSCLADLCLADDRCVSVGGGAAACVPEDLPANASCGTVATGLCRGSLQCVLPASGGSGTCQALARAGQVCSTTGLGNPDCDIGANALCVSGRCQTVTWTGPGGSCIEPALCDVRGFCDVNNRCTSRPGVGQSCAAAPCARNLFCDPVTLVCRARGGPGALCSSSDECRSDLVCTGPAGLETCQAFSWQSCSSSTPDAGIGDGGLDAGGPDGGLDAGVDVGPQDGGLDGGVVDAGPGPSCSVNANCGTGQLCLDNLSFAACGSSGSCSCFDTCDSFAVASSCAAGRSCFWRTATTGPTSGACVPDVGGGLQGAACTATFDASGNQVSSTCNVSQNFFCIGATPAARSGICARICAAGTNTLCASIASSLFCDSAPGASVGICVAAQSFTDIGRACTTNASCQSGFCSFDFGDLCSASCSLTLGCPVDSTCVVFPNGSQQCGRDCAPGAAGTTFCSSLAPGATCFNLGGGQGVCLGPP